ncbi:MAG: hypothetical protein U0271_48330 [Polyangiaceae bacterium]
MAKDVEVRVQGRGRVRDGSATVEPSERAVCDLCGQESDAVASLGANGSGPFGCKACLRGRLEAMTLAAWMLREQPESRLPWGKVSG